MAKEGWASEVRSGVLFTLNGRETFICFEWEAGGIL